jgi:hypothetical protein
MRTETAVETLRIVAETIVALEAPPRELAVAS